MQKSELVDYIKLFNLLLVANDGLLFFMIAKNFKVKGVKFWNMKKSRIIQKWYLKKMIFFKIDLYSKSMLLTSWKYLLKKILLKTLGILRIG